jgi:hypothetical protein
MHVLKADFDIPSISTPAKNLVFLDSCGHYDSISNMLSSTVTIQRGNQASNIDNLLTSGESTNIPLL